MIGQLMRTMASTSTAFSVCVIDFVSKRSAESVSHMLLELGNVYKRTKIFSGYVLTVTFTF